LKDLIKNKEIINEIDELINNLYVLGVDSRQLELVKIEFERRNLTEGGIHKDHFGVIIETAFKHRSKELVQAGELIIKHCCLKEDGKEGEIANFDRFIILHDFFQYLPHKVKKDKNKSTEIGIALKGNPSDLGHDSIEMLKRSES
jgi:hypothetical protein